MLQIVVPSHEYYDELKNEFITVKGQVLQLEHSLVSISKWESKWNKPFLSKEKKTVEEFLDYVRCMTLTQNVNPMVYRNINDKIAKQIMDYIEAPMSATWFNEAKTPVKRSSEVVTSELIYYWMVALQIPFECQKWHFNRLMTLIRICNIKNAPKKKMSKSEILSRNAALNAARRKSMGSSG
jgi:hypothetical protein